MKLFIGGLRQQTKTIRREANNPPICKLQKDRPFFNPNADGGWFGALFFRCGDIHDISSATVPDFQKSAFQSPGQEPAGHLCFSLI
jgi:hypothetical protein